MPSIKSTNPDARVIQGPSLDNGYQHGIDRGASNVPVAFQVTSPFDSRKSLLPHALVMHVNPNNLGINYSKRVETIQTLGGFVEQHWPESLSDVSGSGSTGAFMNIYTGLATSTRQRTIAWDRFQDLYDLYRNNGCIYNPSGRIVLRGNVMMMFDRGVYLGYFTSFSKEETAETPYSFNLTWNFKIEQELVKVPFPRNPNTNINPFG